MARKFRWPERGPPDSARQGAFRREARSPASKRAGASGGPRSWLALGALAFFVWVPLRRAARGDLPPEVEAFQTRGDAETSLAEPAYVGALQSWSEAQALAEKFGDDAAFRRSIEARAGIAILLRDPAIFERTLRELVDSEKRRGTAVGAQASNLAAEALLKRGRGAPFETTPQTSMAPQALERLRKFLVAAKSKFPSLPDRDERDALAIVQLLALVEKGIGDDHTRRADSFYREALSKLEAAPSAADLASAARRQLAKARLRYRLRDFRAARELLLSPTGGFSLLPLPERKEWFRLLRDLARFEGDRPRYLVAIEELQKLGEKAEEAPRPGVPSPRLFVASPVDLAATAQTLLGILMGWKLDPWERALVAYVASGATEELGEYALSEEILRAQSPPVDEDPWLAAVWASKLGFVRGELGSHEAALASLAQAERLASGIPGADRLLARIAVNRARSALALGQLDEAREIARKVSSSSHLPAEMRVTAGILLAGALYEESREEPRRLFEAKRAVEAARGELEKAKAAGEAMRDPLGLEAMLSIVLGNIVRAEALGLEGEAAEARRARAIQLGEEALRAAYAHNLLPLAAIASSNLGELYLESGKLEAAQSFVEWALARAKEKKLLETEWRCHWYLGRIADARGQTERADREYALAEEIIASYRSSILQAERKAGFLTDKVGFYRDLVRRQIRAKNPEAALSAAERAKARALVESLGMRFLAFSDPATTALYREHVLLESRAEKERKCPSSSFLGVAAKPVDYAEIQAKVAEIRSRLERELPRGHILRALVSGGSVEAKEILSAIGPESALVEYFALDDSYVALVASGGSIEALPLPVTPDELSRTATAFAQSWAEDATAGKKLYGWLIRPIADRIQGRRLFVVPHGVLYQVPFEAFLEEPEPRGGREPTYLLRRLEIVYLPSASLKPLLRERAGGSSGGLSLFAVQDPATDYNGDGKPDLPPLPRAGEEIGALSPYFANRVILAGPAATERKVMEGVSAADVVHYACHAEFYPQRPWDSSLFLAPDAVGDDGGDGRLKASEALGYDLSRTRLVALSGCETGRGRVLPGDDTVSISTAFLHSGAKALVVTLWKVEDRAASLLMRSFYKNWLGERKDKARSLREAKLELIAGEFSRPRFWSAFILIGEP